MGFRACIFPQSARALNHEATDEQMCIDLNIEAGTAAIEKCMNLLHSEAFSPTLIWNREMRGKVVEYVDERANDLAVSIFWSMTTAILMMIL